MPLTLFFITGVLQTCWNVYILFWWHPLFLWFQISANNLTSWSQGNRSGQSALWGLHTGNLAQQQQPLQRSSDIFYFLICDDIDTAARKGNIVDNSTLAEQAWTSRLKSSFMWLSEYKITWKHQSFEEKHYTKTETVKVTALSTILVDSSSIDPVYKFM